MSAAKRGDAAWRAADRKHTRAAYRAFLEDYPEHPRCVEARRKVGNLDWIETCQAPTPESLQRFINQHPDHARVDDAKRELGNLAFLAAKQEGTVQALQRFIDQHPDHHKVPRARELIEGERVHIANAISRGWLKATVTGAGLSSVTVQMRRLEARRMRVQIPAGTYFICGGRAQNMVSRRDTVVAIGDDSLYTEQVAAACAQFHQPEPGSGDRFSIRADAPGGNLRALMKVIDEQGAPTVPAQVAIWAVTDNPSRWELDRTYQETSSLSPLPSPAASDEDIARAGALLEAAGIDPTSRRLFRE